MTRLINLTPHAINFCHKDGRVFKTVQPSGNIARIDVKVTQAPFDIHPDDSSPSIPLFNSVFGEVSGFPEVDSNVKTAFIVSSVLKAVLANAQGEEIPIINGASVFAPSTLVRDDKGNVIGTLGLT